jgi:hypothetical protein
MYVFLYSILINLHGENMSTYRHMDMLTGVSIFLKIVRAPANINEDSNSGGGGSFPFAGVLIIIGLFIRRRLKYFLPRSYNKNIDKAKPAKTLLAMNKSLTGQGLIT